MTNHARRACGVVALCSVLALPAATSAQLSASLWTLTTVEVKHDMVLEWEALQRELNRAYHEAGITERRVAEVIRGPANEY